jgi:hypothetical protein
MPVLQGAPHTTVDAALHTELGGAWFEPVTSAEHATNYLEDLQGESP